MLVLARGHLSWSFSVVFACLATISGVHLVEEEVASSRLQSQVLTREAGDHYFWLSAGDEPAYGIAPNGPFDQRRGYTEIPGWVEHLDDQGFEVTWRAGLSGRARAASELGLYPIYRPSAQAGLTILGDDGSVLHEHRTPQVVYDRFEELPDLMVETLLFIENRSLLEPGFRERNPAIEWRRFVAASAALLGREMGRTDDHFGGSTLATQIEKFRHSPGGLTIDEAEKLRQMTTAALRAYRQGRETSDHQRSIVLDYINGVPLAASPGYGEVLGVADGLRVWYGADPKEVQYSLERLQTPSLSGPSGPTATSAIGVQDALHYRMVLSLFLAQRRPTYYLAQNPDDLADLTDSYARILATQGVISPALRDAVIAERAPVLSSSPAAARRDFQQRKAVDAVRSALLGALEVNSFYELDRHDLYVQSTIDGDVQQQVDHVLQRLHDPEFLREQGLFGHRLLRPDDPIEELIVSFTLFEATEFGNALRVLADNHDQPLNINEHVKLDLGSTAKLRTLVTYLEVVAALHDELADAPMTDIRRIAREAPDGLRRWVAGHLVRHPQATRAEVVEAAMDRSYSANPDATFFTGGGLHRFSNFENRRNHTQSVREAFRHSVNLPFIRIMQDIVDYYTWLDPSRMDEIFSGESDEERAYLLARFADR